MVIKIKDHERSYILLSVQLLYMEINNVSKWR